MRLRPTFEHPLAGHYSRPGGPWDVPCLGEAIGREGGLRTALVDGDVTLTRAAVESAAGALAAHLLRRGVGRGDVVAWQLPNWYEAVLLYRACWLRGAIAVPLNHRLGPADLVALLELLEPAVMVSSLDAALSELGSTLAVRDGSGAFDEMLTGPVLEPEPVRGGDIAVGMLTSGSTGQPKIVLHTHRALAYKARIHREVHGLRAEDVVLMPVPLSHVAGLLNGVVAPGVIGMTTVLIDVWDAEDALQLVEERRVTYMGGPSVFLTAMVESPAFQPSRVRSLRLSSMGGSTMTPAALATLADRLGCTVKRAYGSTEAPTMTTMHEGDPEDKGRETDGRACGEAEVIVVDPATGMLRASGEVGEIWLRAPEMFAGYALASQTDQAVTDAGWLRTGDLGVLDADGWLTVAGRIKELIIRGGENIATAEIEGLLESHPKVRHASAVGYPDAIFGERVAAVVVAEEDFDLDECRRWFSERGVAKFKTPEVILHVESVPMLATGKADRSALKAHVADIMAKGT